MIPVPLMWVVSAIPFVLSLCWRPDVSGEMANRGTFPLLEAPSFFPPKEGEVTPWVLEPMNAAEALESPEV